MKKKKSLKNPGRLKRKTHKNPWLMMLLGPVSWTCFNTHQSGLRERESDGLHAANTNRNFLRRRMKH